MKKNFVSGAFIFTLGIIISRALGIFFVFPFAKMVGPIGLSLYSYAYVPYAIFIDISTMGVPLGLSKLVAKYNTKGHYKTSRRILFFSLSLMVLIGFISFLLMNSLSDIYASRVLAGTEFENTLKDVSLVIKMVSYSILIIPVVSAIRGYLQGYLKMAPTAISQITE